MATSDIRHVKAVFFDLYNTLARFWPPREEVQATAAAAFGYAVTPEGIARGYLRADAFMSRENARSQVQRRSLADQLAFFTEYERLVLEGAGVDASPSVTAQVWERVRQASYKLALFDDVAEGLTRLRADGYITGVISNMDTPAPRLSRDLGLSPLADVVVTSGDVGVGKPHAPIFAAALAQAGVDAGKAAHVGDSVSGDVEGALAAGIAPIFMNRYPDTPPEAPLPPGVPTAHDMAGVAALLRGGG